MPILTQTAGSGTPNALGFSWQALGLGFSSYPMNAVGSNNSALTSQTVNGTLLGAQSGQVITSVVVVCVTGAAGASPAGMFVALYSTAGTRLAVSANVNTAASWPALTFVSVALTAPFTVTTSGGLYGAILQNGSFGTTNPTFQLPAAGLNTNVAYPSGVFAAVNQVGQATMPTPATFTGGGNNYWMGWA
jgi:hypothetical protein